MALTIYDVIRLGAMDPREPFPRQCNCTEQVTCDECLFYDECDE